MPRRRLVLATAATAILAGSGIGRAAELRRLRVFSVPGAPADALARRVAQALGVTTQNRWQPLVDNVGFSAASPLTDFRFRRGRDLYVMGLSQFKRLEQIGRLNITDFFAPVRSLGSQPAVLASSLQSRLSDLMELGRVRGTLRLPMPAKLMSGPPRDLAPLFVWPRLAPRLTVTGVENDHAPPGVMLANNEIDLATVFLDDLRPGRQSATLLGSSLLNAADSRFDRPSLETFTNDLPINEEYILAVDSSWSQADTASLRQLLMDGGRAIDDAVREVMPSLQPSRLQAVDLARSISSHYLSRQAPALVGDALLPCNHGADCAPRRLTDAALTRALALHQPDGKLFQCSDSPAAGSARAGTPGVTTGLPKPGDLCLNPLADSTSADKTAAKKDERNWWTTLKALFTKGSDLRDVAPQPTVKWADMTEDAMNWEFGREEKTRKEIESNRPKPDN